MQPDQRYDMVVTGGGLSGLAFAIQSARAGYKVALFEKERFPFHKVCGEYISHESWNFLEDLGLPLSEMNLPEITRLMISAPNGKYLEENLQLGGFGVSRFLIEKKLADLAIENGVHLFESTKVLNVLFRNGQFVIFTNRGETEAQVVAGAFGKRSNLDVKWKRGFTRLKPNWLNHWVGVKYHIHCEQAADLIGLHNFEQGYCGISRVEDGKYCLCYLTTARNLRKNHYDIHEMERNILMKNPFLSQIFSSSHFNREEPLTVSRISFNKKTQVENHVLLIGDSAGMVNPLFGNGMSMALHSSKIAFEQAHEFLGGRINRFEMEQQYVEQWEKQFGRRMMAGRLLQRFWGTVYLTNGLIGVLKKFPRLMKRLVRLSHGQPY